MQYIVYIIQYLANIEFIVWCHNSTQEIVINAIDTITKNIIIARDYELNLSSIDYHQNIIT